MTRFFSKALVKWLLKMGAISQHDTEVYEYGIYSFLFSLLPFSLVLVLSMPLSMVSEGLLLIVPFFFLRKFTGGFHFSSALLCMLVSTIVLSAFLLGIRALILSSWSASVCIAVYLSLIPIAVFSPIDSANRRLSQKEKRIFRKIAIALGAIFAAIFTLFLLLGIPHVAIPIGAGIVLTSLLQLPCLWELRKNVSRR